MGKGTFILGLGVGYVLGTRDGRERYEQIKARATGVWNSPRVQDKVGAAEQTAKRAADTATQKVGERLPGGGSGASTPTSQEPASRATSTTRAGS
jgi:hypothetical protein